MDVHPEFESHGIYHCQWKKWGITVKIIVILVLQKYMNKKIKFIQHRENDSQVVIIVE